MSERTVFQEEHRNGQKRLALTLGVLIVFALICFAGPRPLNYVFIGVSLAFGVTGIWSIRPGRCVMCQRTTLIALPERVPYKHREWWDPRSPSRKDVTWACPPHLKAAMKMLVARQMMEQEDRA